MDKQAMISEIKCQIDELKIQLHNARIERDRDYLDYDDECDLAVHIGELKQDIASRQANIKDWQR